MNSLHSTSHSVHVLKFISQFRSTPKFCILKRNVTSNLENYGSNHFSNSTASTSIKAARDGVDTAVVVEEEGPKLRKFQVFEGHPVPFGATVRDGGVNFAIFSANAVSATLCLISLSDLPENTVTEQFFLDPLTNKTGDVWHVHLKGDFKDMLYGYKFGGSFSPEEGHYYDPSQIVLDPYAKAVISRGDFGVFGSDDNCWPQMACMIPTADDKFDWEGDSLLKYPQRDLIIYEMHVRGFTQHESSRTEFPGTYLGVVEKLDHLKELGVNCIELMPCHEFNELEYYSYNSVLGDYKCSWMLFSITQLKEMREVPFYLSKELIIVSITCLLLRYWVIEMHVDGFRFDLASIMTRSSSLWDAVNVFGSPIEGDLVTTGTPLGSPPLIEMMSNDPILRDVKLIAEAWDAGGLYQVGMFPHWHIWSEWNGKYRDIVRQVIKGTDGFSGAFAECLCGSPDLYQERGRKPWNSINFVCAHDGFTLADLVTYNEKHNLANGEDNNDGENHNNSWNCGQEGELTHISVKKLRKRQMRNFFLCLMVSQGVPMIHMGDEYGHTKGGNNNTYCHDNYINYFWWDKKEESSSDFFRFCRLMTKFRHECESLGSNDFPTAERLQWHGHAPGTPDWSETSRFVAFTLIDSVKREIYIAFNASYLPVIITLPERPAYRWEPLVDTAKPAPFEFLSCDLPERDTAMKQYSHFLEANLYPMLSYSSIILVLLPVDNA
ncbi:PREDICTED: isoamylase 1, chloroplastic-like isoform X4 [Populus euphratica]|uniref:Isoamylase 1, chloroplastic-like isoform X4 n=1 Tax=Populus euphratica TaxID=75702 RepID=A0AAJ6TV93_POPEU|nr:PREDICTED: isoamylase 1, chloroplastic-like isoform X4 [Populus euphratica]